MTAKAKFYAGQWGGAKLPQSPLLHKKEARAYSKAIAD